MIQARTFYPPNSRFCWTWRATLVPFSLLYIHTECALRTLWAEAASPDRFTNMATPVLSLILPVGCSSAPCAQDVKVKTLQPRAHSPRGRNPDPPHAAPVAGPHDTSGRSDPLSHGLARGAGSRGQATPGGTLPPASTCRDSPDIAGAAIFPGRL